MLARVDHRLLSLANHRREPGQCVRSNDQACCDRSFSRGNVALAADLLEFLRESLQEIVLLRGGNIDRNEHVALDGTLNGGTVLGHDRETGLNGNKTIIAQRVGLSDVGSNIAIWLAQVGQEGAEECRVALISELERLLAIWTGLCVCDGFIDDGIRCDTLYVPEQGEGSVISGFHSFSTINSSFRMLLSCQCML